MRLTSSQPPLGTPLNRSHPLTQGLVGCWPLNEFGGKTAYNITGYGFLNGGFTTTGVSYVIKQNGIAAFFDIGAGTGIYIDCGTSLPSQLLTPLTISIWFQTTTARTDAYLMSHANFRTDLFGFEFFMSVGQIFFYIDGAAGTSTLHTTPTYNDGKWHNAVAVADGTNQFIYVDGRQITSTAQTQTPSYTTLYKLLIGNSEDSTLGIVHPWDGYMNNVMLWGRALTASEIAGLYANPYSMFQGYEAERKTAWQLVHVKLNNSGIRPRPFAPGIAR